jgi:hypothetical protein
MAQANVSAPGQTIVQEGTLQTLTWGVWQGGRGVLTTEHFYFLVKGYGLFNYFGLLGRAINLIFPERTKNEIPLSSITAVGRGKMGLLKDVLRIETADGKKYQFSPDYQFWLEGLKNTLQTKAGVVLVQSGEERWERSR